MNSIRIFGDGSQASLKVPELSQRAFSVKNYWHKGQVIDIIDIFEKKKGSRSVSFKELIFFSSSKVCGVW